MLSIWNYLIEKYYQMLVKETVYKVAYKFGLKAYLDRKSRKFSI